MHLPFQNFLSSLLRGNSSTTRSQLWAGLLSRREFSSRQHLAERAFFTLWIWSDMERVRAVRAKKKNSDCGSWSLHRFVLGFFFEKNRASHGWFRLRVSVGRFGTVGIGSLPGMMILTAIDYIEGISWKRKTMEKKHPVDIYHLDSLRSCKIIPWNVHILCYPQVKSKIELPDWGGSHEDSHFMLTKCTVCRPFNRTLLPSLQPAGPWNGHLTTSKSSLWTASSQYLMACRPKSSTKNLRISCAERRT